MPGYDIGSPTHATLNWEYKSNPLNPLTWRILTTPRVYVEYIMVESMEYNTKYVPTLLMYNYDFDIIFSIRYRLRLCPMFEDPVKSQEPKMFLPEYCNSV